MKPATHLIIMIIVVLFSTLFSYAQETKTEDYHRWWNEGYRRRPRNNPQAKKLPLARLQGNKFVNPDGETVLFRGLSISNPDKLKKPGALEQEAF